MNFKRNLNSWTINIVLIVFLISIPIFIIYTGLLGGDSPTWDHITYNLLPQYIANTTALAIGTVVLTLCFGTLTAWLVAAYDFPLRRQLSWLLVLPLTIPTYIAAYAYSGLFEYTGPIFSLLRNNFGIESAGINVRNIYGAIFVISAVLYPYVYIAARASFLVDSGRLFEAARTLGSTPFSNFWRIVLPVSRPAIVAGLSLVVMEVLNEYGAVKYYGISTFTTGIFRAWFSLEDLQAAIYLSAILMTFVFTLIIAERLQRGRKQFKSGSDSLPLGRYKLNGSQKYLALAACIIPFTAGFILPIIQLLYWATFTFGKVIRDDIGKLIANSFSLSFIAALICVIASVLLVYSVRLSRNNKSEIFSKIASLGYSIPGAAMAVGIMMTTLFIDQVFLRSINLSTGLILTGSMFALLYAYVVRYLAVGYNPIDSGFRKITLSLTEVSQTLGVSPLRSLFSINLPLLKPALWSALLLVFVDVMKELPLTLILRPFNFETLATRAFRYANDEMVPESAPVSLVIIATALIPIILLNRKINQVQ